MAPAITLFCFITCTDNPFKRALAECRKQRAVPLFRPMGSGLSDSHNCIGCAERAYKDGMAPYS